jgi:hypothetical protein
MSSSVTLAKDTVDLGNRQFEAASTQIFLLAKWMKERRRTRGTRRRSSLRGPRAYKGTTSRRAEEIGRRLSALLTDTLRLVRSGHVSPAAGLMDLRGRM